MSREEQIMVGSSARSLATSGPPAISVAMAVHNGVPYVEEAVRSILAQTYAEFEFVIGDDGSDDGTSEVLNRIAAEDPRIRLLRRARKSGLAASANWVVSEARAPFVAIAHADDRSLPDRLLRQVAVLQAVPEAVLVGTLSEGIDEQGRFVRPAEYWRLCSQSVFAPFPHSSIMFRRDAFVAVGGYRVEAEYWEDFDLYHRLACRGRLLVVPEILTSTRHALVSTRLRDEQQRVENAADLMFRCAHAYGRNGDVEKVLRAGTAVNAKLHPRTFVSCGSTRLWSGRRPHVLMRMLRRGRLRADLDTLRALVWALWAEVSPRSLRKFIRAVLRLWNRAAKRQVADDGAVEWCPEVLRRRFIVTKSRPPSEMGNVKIRESRPRSPGS